MFEKKQLLTENASPLKVKCFAECAGLNRLQTKLSSSLPPVFLAHPPSCSDLAEGLAHSSDPQGF